MNAAIILILGLVIMWAAATGRAEAIWEAIKGPKGQ